MTDDGYLLQRVPISVAHRFGSTLNNKKANKLLVESSSVLSSAFRVPCGAAAMMSSIASSSVPSSTTPGYWEPHTSSIDFCESNYLHSHYVAEPHNVWSSILGISLVGLWGLVAGNPTGEIRYILLYIILIAVGLGSACLHGTLHWVFQSSDEVPMIYLVICLTYCILEVKSPKGRPKYPLLPRGMVGVAIINTLVYYKFQHLYWVFIATFLLLTTIAIASLIKLLFFENEPQRPEVTRLVSYANLMYICIGMPIWVIDMLFCPHILTWVDRHNSIFCGMTPHVLWHLAAGFGAYLFAIASSCCRLDALKIPYKVSYAYGGWLPIVRTVADVKKHKNR